MLMVLTRCTKTSEQYTVIFPVRCHSYMPTDKIFERRESMYRKHSVISLKQDYEKILKELGTVRKIETDWVIHNVKETSDKH